MSYVVFDLEPSCPMLVLLDQNPWSAFKKVKPVGLFLNAHFKNQFLNRVELLSDFGRVVKFVFGADENTKTLEFRCITKQPNLILEAGQNKSISWAPVSVLQKQQGQYADEPAENEEMRSIRFLFNEWKRSRFLFKEKSSPVVSPYERWVKKVSKDRDKKKKALEAISQQIQAFQNEPWAPVGEHLKIHGKKNIPPEWTPYVDFEKSTSENMQKCFEKAKAAKSKLIGAEQRLQLLRNELQDLSDLSEEKFQKSLILSENKQKKLQSRPVQGRLRKFQLEDSSITAYMGKSAADNMSLLRQSKPHDLWLHLKDYPSAHAVIHRQKSQSVADSYLQSVAKWLLQEGLSKNQQKMGGKYAVVVVECRHVKPLKGDKMGRVTYHNAREFLIAI